MEPSFKVERWTYHNNVRSTDHFTMNSPPGSIMDDTSYAKSKLEKKKDWHQERARQRREQKLSVQPNEDSRPNSSGRPNSSSRPNSSGRRNREDQENKPLVPGSSASKPITPDFAYEGPAATDRLSDSSVGGGGVELVDGRGDYSHSGNIQVINTTTTSRDYSESDSDDDNNSLTLEADGSGKTDTILHSSEHKAPRERKSRGGDGDCPRRPDRKDRDNRGHHHHHHHRHQQQQQHGQPGGGGGGRRARGTGGVR